MTSHDELLDNVAAYALGFLPPAEADAVAAHLQTCERCGEEYRVLRPAVTAVAYCAEADADASAGPAAPSPLLKARLMKRVRAQAARSPRVWPAYAVSAACLLVAVLAGAADFWLSSQLARTRAQAAAQGQTIADLTAAGTTRYGFAGGEVLANGNRLYIAVSGLPPLPTGRVYQAWTLAKGAKSVVPSSTFEPAAGVFIVRLPVAATTIAAVAVSVEPEGGSRQPTTKPIALVRI
jgi:anti-sigma-K factor RskA